MKRSTGQEEYQLCASCGKSATTRPETEFHNIPLCEDCADRISAGATVAYFVPTEDEPPTPPEERFEELFKAARALFDVGVVNEDIVYPTLVFANEIWQNLDFAAARERLISAWDDSEAWREEADAFVRAYKGFKPVEVVGQVVFLELQPAFATVRTYQTTNVPKEVEIRVHPRRKLTSPKEVEAAYEEALSEADIMCDVSHRISLESEFNEGVLWILVRNGEVVQEEHAPIVWQVRKPRFPHPRLIGALYNALLGKPTQGKDGFARYLKIRQRSRDPEIYNLIPACVAFFLRRYGELKQGEIHNLLSRSLLRDHHPQREIPKMQDDPQGFQSRKSQLWDDVKKVEQKLLRIALMLYSSKE